MTRIAFVLGFCFLGLSFITFNRVRNISLASSGSRQFKKVGSLSGIDGGFYREFSLSIDSSGQITGVYEYYDHWDEKAKEFLDINLLYIAGHIGQDSVAQINGSWPDSDQHLKGRLRFFRTEGRNEIEINFDKEPNGYNDVSFRKGVIRVLEIPKKWIEVRIVKTSKAHLFNQPDSSTIRKGYLIRNNIVKVIAVSNEGWFQVEYNPVDNHNKSSIFWMRSQDLYGVDPTKW